jgi:hypothetical protein
MITTGLKDTLNLVDIRTVDHLIVAGGAVASMAEKGLVSPRTTRQRGDPPGPSFAIPNRARPCPLCMGTGKNAGVAVTTAGSEARQKRNHPRILNGPNPHPERNF